MALARVAFVVQRYGREVNGGAELLCRMFAEQLQGKLELEVLTSCAIDYLTWKNEYPKGAAEVNGVPVRRFPVAAPRELREFDRYTQWLRANPHTRADEERWVWMQGPNSPQLLDYIQAARERYDAFVFFTYLYLPTCFGLPRVRERALMLPTAHDEPELYLGIYDEVFRAARRLLHLTPEERDTVLRRFCLDEDAGVVLGIGVRSLACAADPFWARFRERLGSSKIVTYMGRIDPSKGCSVLFEYFTRYANEHRDQDIKLLLIGKAAMPIPQHPAILHAGFVPDTAKGPALADSDVLVMPSLYESLSLVLLEAWLAGKPVLANGQCEVLRGQCRRSNGGLWYGNYLEFSGALDRLLSDPDLASALGRQGREWVARTCCWDRVEPIFLDHVSRVIRGAARRRACYA